MAWIDDDVTPSWIVYRRRAAACRRGRVAGTEAVSMGDDTVRRVRLGPRLVHMPPEPSGFATVCNGASFVQVAGGVLWKQARVQNPDKDAVLVDRSGTFASALWSMCRRLGSVDGRGSRPAVGGRPRAGVGVPAA
jgi:hypothetical protein